VAVVSQRFARKFFAGSDAVGRRIRLGGARSQAPWLTVVGVVPDVYSGDPESRATSASTCRSRRTTSPFVSLAVRTRGPPAPLAPPCATPSPR
jgi:hypothetical protein